MVGAELDQLFYVLFVGECFILEHIKSFLQFEVGRIGNISLSPPYVLMAGKIILNRV